MNTDSREHTRKRKILKQVRLSPEEDRALKKWKKWLNLSCESDVIRMFIRSGVGYRFDYTSCGKMVSEVNHIGQNINQLVKMANAKQSVYLSEVTQLQEQVKNLEDLINDFVVNNAEVDKRIGQMFLSESEETDNGSYENNSGESQC